MVYALIIWTLIDYWCAGAWFAYANALNRYAGVHQGPANKADKIVGVIMGILIVLGGPISLLLFKKPKGGKTEEDQFTDAWMGQIKQSFLRLRKTNWLWPVTVVKS